ncbi:protein dispatched homolog 1-like [Glandiceps talaboti]
MSSMYPVSLGDNLGQSEKRRESDTVSSLYEDIDLNDNENPSSSLKDANNINSHIFVISSAGDSTTKTGMDEKKKKKPLAWCKYIVDRPKTAFAVTLSCTLFLPVLTLVLVLSGHDVFPAVLSYLPLQLQDSDQWLRGLAWQTRNEGFLKYEHNVESLQGTSERTQLHNAIYTIYEKEDGNVLSKKNLQAIQDLEDELVSKPNYTDYCQLDAHGECLKPISLVRYFDGTYAALSPIFNDPTFDNIPAVLEAANSFPPLKGGLQFHLGKDISIDAISKVAESSITRSIIPLSVSLGNRSEWKQNKKTQSDFIVDTYYSRLMDLHDDHYKGLGIYFFSQPLWENAVDKQVISDLVLVVGSCVFIFGFIWFQTKSLWITVFAVLGIMASFLSANFIYRYILDFRFFGIFHILSLFIILGIGADDVFVFMDTWTSTGFDSYSGLEYRLSDVYRRASGTMLVTSLTTAVAFFVNGFSPLLAVKTFGIFAGILVIVNYLTVIVFFPTVVIIYHTSWRHCVWCCWLPFVKSRTGSTDKLNQPKERKNKVVRFFKGPYFRFVTHKAYRWIIVLVFVAIVTVFTYFARKLGPDEEAVKIFKDGNNFVEFNDKSSKAFVPSESDETTVYIVWGMENQDLSSCHHTDYECTGQTIWDDSFDLNPTPSQKAIKDFCYKLQNLTEREIADLHIKRDIVTGELKINCFIDNMYGFYQNLNLTNYPNGTDVSMPIGEIEMHSVMNANPDIFDTSHLHDTFYRYFETGLGYWLTMGYTGKANTDYEEYRHLLGEELDKWDSTYTVPGTDIYGTRMKYAAITVKTSLSFGSVGYDSGMKILNAWETFVDNETLADSAVKGIILGITLAFPVLVIATQNVIIGTMATVSIGLTTVCVIGMIPMLGWKLGLLESLNLSLIVGLAVDYVVHLAEGYHLSQKEDRLGRLHDMLEHVGVSVVSGAATTLGASLFMLFAQILLAMQFGIFMFCTIGFSLLFSMGLFTTILGIMGPQGDTGSLLVIYRSVYYCIIGRKKNDVDCGTCDGTGFHQPTHFKTCALAFDSFGSKANISIEKSPSSTLQFSSMCGSKVNSQMGT